MENNFITAQNDFYDEDLLISTANLSKLNADNDFSNSSSKNQDIKSNIDDEEFERLLQEIIDDESDNDFKKMNNGLTFDEERILLDYEIEKIRIERETLELEKEKFARSKREWEALKKLSEESFQAEKEEYEKQKKLDREKMYLETKEIVNSCANFREFFEDYKKIHDVSE